MSSSSLGTAAASDRFAFHRSRSRVRPRRARFSARVGFVLAVPGLLGVAAAQGIAGAQPEEPAASYVVLMAADPVVAYTGDEPGLAPTAPEGGEKIATDDPAVEQYVEHLESTQTEVLDAAGVAVEDRGESFTYALNGFEAELTATEVATMERRPEVAKVVPNELRQLQTDASPAFLGLSERRGAWESGLVGEDVVVGVIDSGIWPEHPSFADDGSYPPLAGYESLPCEFGDSAYNSDDVAFDCNGKLLGARDMRSAYKSVIGPETFNSARDYDGHGTHTASTAVGNSDVPASIFGIDRGIVSGIAPRAPG